MVLMIQDFFNSVPNLDFLLKNVWGVFKIRYEFGYFSAIQVYSHGPRLYFFNSVPNSARFFPFKMHGQFFKFGTNSVPFRLLKFILLVQDFIFSIRCRIRQGFSHLKCMGSFQIRLQFGSISAHQISSPHQETLYFQFGAEFGKGLPI